MTTKRRLPIGLWWLLTLSLPRLLWCEVDHPGPGELASRSDLIAILELAGAVDPGGAGKAYVLRTIRGSIDSDRLSFLYPLPSIDATASYIPPAEGTILLAFLRQQPDGKYAPASGFGRMERLSDEGKVVVEEIYSSTQGNASLKVVEKGEVDTVAELLPLLLNWDSLAQKQRARTFRRLSSGPEVLKRIALDWILRDRGIDLDKPEDLQDPLLEALLSWSESQDLSVRRDALSVLGMISRNRKSLVPFLVDALDDPSTRDIAVHQLDGRGGRGPGPELPPSASIDEKVNILKSWWAVKGSKEPAYRRFTGSEKSAEGSGSQAQFHSSRSFPE